MLIESKVHSPELYNEIPILIVILNWNGWNDTRECLDSVKRLKDANYSVVVVDNGSLEDCDRIREYGQSRFCDYYDYHKEDVLNNEIGCSSKRNGSFTLIRNNENLGFAKANNIGIKYGEVLGFEYIYLLNNDTTVEPDSLYKLIVALRSSNYSVVVPQIRFYSQPSLIWCCGGELDGFYEKYNFKGEKWQHLPDVNLIDITFATGCALLFKRSDVIGLSERFFFGEEDFELSLRLKAKSLRMACVVDSVIYHKESVSIDRSTRYLNKIYVHKLNRLVNIKQYAPLIWPVFIVYRSAKFFLLMLIIERKGFTKSIKYALLLLYQAIKLKEVNKSTFLRALALDLS